MPITITSLTNALKVKDDFEYVISITDLKQGMPNFGPNHIHVKFEDTEDPNDDMYMKVYRILDWVREKKLTSEDNILVHCHAGVSRSSAIAWTLKVMFGEPCREAFRELQAARPEIWPNILVIQIADQILGLKRAFLGVALEIDEEIKEERLAKWKTTRVQWKRGEVGC